MDEKIQKRYKEALRFDQGEIYQTSENRRVFGARMVQWDVLVHTYGDEIVPLLERYTLCLYDEMELECRHFFQQGYLAGLADAGAIKT